MDGVADVLRQGDAGGLEQRADDAGCGRAQGHLLAVFADLDFLEAIEIAQHVTPFGPESGLAAALVQFLAQDQGEERAEHMATDGGVGGVIDRPRAHQRLGGAEQGLDLHQVAVAQNRLQWVETSVGAQHEHAVVAGLIGQLARIDLEGAAIRGGAQIAPISGVADQRFVATLELLIQCGDDGLSVGGVLGRLGLVAADDVAPPLDLDLLSKQLGLRAAGALDAEWRERLFVPEHDGAHQRVGALAGAEHVFQAALLQP